MEHTPAEGSVPTGADGKPLTAGQLKALEREKRKQENAAKRGGGKKTGGEELTDTHGDLPLVLHAHRPESATTFTPIDKLVPSEGLVTVRARIHSTRGSGGLVFVWLRAGLHTVQAVADKNDTSKALVDFVSAVPKESVVNVIARVVAATVTGTTQSSVELKIAKLFVVSRAAPTLPVQIDDCQRPQPVLDAQREEIKTIQSLCEAAAVAFGPEGTADQRRASLESLRALLAAEREAVKSLPEKQQKTRLDKLDAEVAAVASHAAALGLGDAASAAAPAPADEDKTKKVASACEEVLQLLNAKRGAAKKYADVDIDTLLDNRVVYLRTLTNQAIFSIQSAVGRLFREFLTGEGFVEIHTPKMIGQASEGGANVFKLTYFGGDAFLAQSPQLFKQMAVCGGMERVFEIGPVFRAEKSFTARHLTEFTGLDMEMTIMEHYHEVLDVMDRMFVHIFDGLNSQCRAEIEVVRKQFPFQDLKYKLAGSDKSLRLTFAEGIKMLQEAGRTDIDPLEDLSTPDEKLLGKLVEEKYGVEFYFLDKFPANARPFYTMPDKEDPRYTNSYDLFVRHQEIVSGAQRVHDAALLTQRCLAKGVAPETVQAYIDAFKYGAPPHGGCGVGLERVVFLFLGFNNVRYCSLFPRDPNRIAP